MEEKFHFAAMPKGYGQFPQIPSLSGKISNSPATTGINGASFGETLASMLRYGNESIGVPEKLTIEAVQTGKVDIHEIMIASAKSDVAFKLITAITQKIVGAFEKLSSMQV